MPLKGEKQEDENDKLIVSMRLKSGRFESTIEVPLIGTDEDHKDFIDSWLVMMQHGLKIGKNRAR